MADHQIWRLQLNVRTDAPDPARIRSDSERFARAVLERCAESIEARRPGRLVFLRRLPMHLEIGEQELTDIRAIRRYAEELADGVERLVSSSPPVNGSSDSDAAVFEDEAQWIASFLLALARKRKPEAWFYKGLANGRSYPDFTVPVWQRQTRAALILLAREGGLNEVVSKVPEAVVESLAELIGVEGRVNGKAAVPSAIKTKPYAALMRLFEVARALPKELSNKAMTLVLYVHAEIILGSMPPDEIRQVVRQAFDERARERPAEKHPGEPSEERPVEQEPQSTAAYRTQYGGLFYLIGLMLELKIGELLWQACLNEGEVLTQAIEALLGESAEDDPAPRLFGGVGPDRSEIVVSEEQLLEIAPAVVTELALVLPRHGLAHLPEISLGFVDHSNERLLVAVADGQSFVLYAWPALSPDAVVEGIRIFLRAWPANAPPVYGSPALAELDPTGRVWPKHGDVLPSGLLLPAGQSSAAAALLAQVVGCACYLFAARVGNLPSSGWQTLVQRYFALPGRVKLEPESTTIRLPMECIDIDVRRAGLDRDPGWVAWLGRKVGIVFEEDG